MANLKMVKLDHEAMMDCIHCGLCLSQCPTYAEDGLEADSPRGRIYLMRALAEGRAEPTPEVTQHFDSCLGCRACETACPSGVQYGHLLENTREFIREEQAPTVHRSPTVQVLEAVFPFPSRLDALLILVRIGRATKLIPLAQRLGLMKLLGPMGAMEESLPPLRSFGTHRKFPMETPARGNQTARVGMVTGCVLPVVQPQVNEATARVLSKAGCHVDAPRNQRCCGALHAHGGDMETARSFARHNIALFEEWQQQHGAWDAIIINAAGCGAALKEYESWLADDEAWRERATRFVSKVRDVSEFLAQEPFANRLQVLAERAQRGESVPGTKAPGREARAERPLDAASDDTHELHRSPESLMPTRPTDAQPEASQTGTLVPGTKAAFAHTLQVLAAPREAVPNMPGASSLTSKPASPWDRANAVAATESDAATRAPEPSSQRANASRVTYHDACHLAHGQGIRAQPRKMVKVATDGLGLELVPLAESEMCCGSAGTYNILQPKMANQLLQRKMANIEATGAQVVVSANIGCTMQLRKGARQMESPLEIVHPIELLDRATEDSASS